LESTRALDVRADELLPRRLEHERVGQTSVIVGGVLEQAVGDLAELGKAIDGLGGGAALADEREEERQQDADDPEGNEQLDISEAGADRAGDSLPRPSSL
jgi:hypothetical protein